MFLVLMFLRRRKEEKIRDMLAHLESERLARRIAEENLSTTDKGIL